VGEGEAASFGPMAVSDGERSMCGEGQGGVAWEMRSGLDGAGS